MIKTTTVFLAAMFSMAVLLMGGSPAHAVGVDGSFSLAGALEDSQGNFDPNGTLDFTAGINAGTTSATGDFAPLFDTSFPTLSPATFFDLTYDPYAGGTPTLYTVTDLNGDLWTFVIDSLVINHRENDDLTLQGLGTISCTPDGAGTDCNFDPTQGNWRMTAQTSNSFETFSFSHSNNFPVVSEPASLGMFGIGLLGLAFLWRRRERGAV